MTVISTNIQLTYRFDLLFDYEYNSQINFTLTNFSMPFLTILTKTNHFVRFQLVHIGIIQVPLQERS